MSNFRKLEIPEGYKIIFGDKLKEAMEWETSTGYVRITDYEIFRIRNTNNIGIFMNPEIFGTDVDLSTIDCFYTKHNAIELIQSAIYLMVEDVEECARVEISDIIALRKHDYCYDYGIAVIIHSNSKYCDGIKNHTISYTDIIYNGHIERDGEYYEVFRFINLELPMQYIALTQEFKDEVFGKIKSEYKSEMCPKWDCVKFMESDIMWVPMSFVTKELPYTMSEPSIMFTRKSQNAIATIAIHVKDSAIIKTFPLDTDIQRIENKLKIFVGELGYDTNFKMDICNYITNNDVIMMEFSLKFDKAF